MRLPAAGFQLGAYPDGAPRSCRARSQVRRYGLPRGLLHDSVAFGGWVLLRRASVFSAVVGPRALVLRALRALLEPLLPSLGGAWCLLPPLLFCSLPPLLFSASGGRAFELLLGRRRRLAHLHRLGRWLARFVDCMPRSAGFRSAHGVCAEANRCRRKWPIRDPGQQCLSWASSINSSFLLRRSFGPRPKAVHLGERGGDGKVSVPCDNLPRTR